MCIFIYYYITNKNRPSSKWMCTESSVQNCRYVSIIRRNKKIMFWQFFVPKFYVYLCYQSLLCTKFHDSDFTGSKVYVLISLRVSNVCSINGKTEIFWLRSLRSSIFTVPRDSKPKYLIWISPWYLYTYLRKGVLTERRTTKWSYKCFVLSFHGTEP